MSTTITVTAPGADLRVFIEPSMQGARAYGLAFDDEADVVAETSSRQFIGYCRGCIVQSIVDEMLPYTDCTSIDVHMECECD